MERLFVEVLSAVPQMNWLRLVVVRVIWWGRKNRPRFCFMLVGLLLVVFLRRLGRIVHFRNGWSEVDFCTRYDLVGRGCAAEAACTNPVLCGDLCRIKSSPVWRV